MRALRALLPLLLLAAAPAGAERILDLETRIGLGPEDAFRVEERIRYDFEGERRHGIYRVIPVRYGRGHAADYRIGLDVEAVRDAAGEPRPFRVEREGRNLRVRIGDPDRLVSGVQEYRLLYRVRRGILWLDGHDELYWNATGTDWKVPIERASARVELPPAAGDKEVELACFTGRHGAVESACVARRQGDTVRFEAERALRPGEGLTLVLGLPKGVLEEPSARERALARASDYWSAWVLLPALALAGMLGIWRAWGRDPEGRVSIPVRYDPPDGMTPAELGIVYDESADIDDVTSTILDLAVRGHLEIHERETSRLLFLSSTDYELVRRDRPTDDLRRHERKLLGALFEGRERVRVSQLKNEFYKELPGIRDALYRRVSREDGYFPASPQRVRRLWAAGGVGLVALGVVLWFGGVAASAGISIALTGVIVLAFSRIMPRRTRKGRRAYEEVLGFREFLLRVDADRLERMGGRSAERFERILPYAIVLGAADAWAEAFAGIYTEPPRWYHGRGVSFHPRAFTSDLGRSLQTMGSAMTSKPSGGSGSSGLGGGGFSGGGFGGGGGGSW